MNTTELCNKRRETLLPRWAECFFSGYPLESTGFLRSRQDPFANPVGQTTRDALAALYDAVAGADMDADTVKNALDKLMHLRAVQDMSPSHAVGPLYLIKNILREHVLPACLESNDKDGLSAYLALESRVDSLALMALDMYTGAREKVFNLRVEEIKRSQSQILRWAKERGADSDPNLKTANLEG